MQWRYIIIPFVLLAVPVPEPYSARTEEQGSSQAMYTYHVMDIPSFNSHLLLVSKTGVSNRSISPRCLHVLPVMSFTMMMMPWSIFRITQNGQWLTNIELKNAYFHMQLMPPMFLSRRHFMSFHSAAIHVC